MERSSLSAHKASCLFSLLSQDELAHVFFQVCLHGLHADGFHFVETCKQVWSIVAKGGAARLQFENYLAHSRVRLPAHLETLEERYRKWSNLEYRTALANQRASTELANAFLLADREMALHCANDCCGLARLGFAEQAKLKEPSWSPTFRIDIVNPSIRRVCQAAESGPLGGPIIFFYYAKHYAGSQSTVPWPTGHMLAKRSYATNQRDFEYMELSMQESGMCDDNARLFDDSLVCSPDGRFCCFLRDRDPGAQDETSLHLWDTHAGNGGNGKAAVSHLSLDLEFLSKVHRHEASAYPSKAWWYTRPSDGKHELLVAWYFLSMTRLYLSVGIVCHLVHEPAHSGVGDSCVDTTQRWVLTPQSNFLRHAHFANRHAVLFHEYTTNVVGGCLFDFSGDNADEPRVYSLSAANSSYAVVGSAQHEMFKDVLSVCTSRDGRRVAVLAWHVDHSYSPPGPPPPGRAGAMKLVLFTRANHGRYLYRQMLGKDECNLWVAPETPEKPYNHPLVDWKVGFSPCESMLHVSRKHHSYPLKKVDYPSVFFVCIKHDGLRVLPPAEKTKLRDLHWCSPNTMVPLLKYGGVLLSRDERGEREEEARAVEE